MSAHATQPTQPDPGQQAEDAQLYRCVLHELIHIGTDLARLTHQKAVAHAQAALQNATPSTPHEDHAAAFDRIARAIRRSIALARTLTDPPPPAPAPRAARTPTPQRPEDAPIPSATPEPDTDAPTTNHRDRPDAPDQDDDVTNRPIAEVIAEICRDLAVPVPSSVSTQATPAHTPTPTRPRPQAAPTTPAPSATPHPNPKPLPTRPIPPHPSNPARTMRADPAPNRTLPDDPAQAIAMVLHRPTQAEARWRPPPPT